MISSLAASMTFATGILASEPSNKPTQQTLDKSLPQADKLSLELLQFLAEFTDKDGQVVDPETLTPLTAKSPCTEKAATKDCDSDSTKGRNLEINSETQKTKPNNKEQS